MTISAEDFRASLKHWASGVTIVTSRTGDAVHGMTVSAFSSVSLEPPLVLICADKGSDTHAVIREGGVFAANVLARGQQELSNRFAVTGNEAQRFDGLAWTTLATGAPVLPGVLACLDCRVTAAHDAGDHVIYVGSVEAAQLGEGEPLVYYAGSYASLALREG